MYSIIISQRNLYGKYMFSGAKKKTPLENTPNFTSFCLSYNIHMYLCDLFRLNFAI